MISSQLFEMSLLKDPHGEHSIGYLHLLLSKHEVGPCSSLWRPKSLSTALELVLGVVGALALANSCFSIIAGFTNLLHALQALQVSGDKLLACVVHSCILGLVPAAPSISASDGAGVGVGDGGGVSLLLLLLPLLRLDRWREGDLGRDLEDPEGDLLLLLLDPSPLWLLPEGRAGHLLIHGYRF